MSKAGKLKLVKSSQYIVKSLDLGTRLAGFWLPLNHQLCDLGEITYLLCAAMS